MTGVDEKVRKPASSPTTLGAAPAAFSASDGITVDPDPTDAATLSSEPPAVDVTQDQLLRQQRRARQLSRYQDDVRLHRAGVSVRRIAQQLGMDRQSIRHYLHAGAFPEITQRHEMPSILDRWEPYLLERWQAGCHNALQLYREIHAQGYTGSCPLVSRWAARYRREHPAMAETVATATPERPAIEARPPMRRLSQAAWLLVQQPADLTEDEHAALAKLQKAVADIATAYTLAQDIIRMLQERTADALTD